MKAISQQVITMSDTAEKYSSLSSIEARPLVSLIYYKPYKLAFIVFWEFYNFFNFSEDLISSKQ